MRLVIIKYLGANIDIIGVKISLLFAKLKLSVSAERVDDLSVKPAFATLTYNFAKVANLQSTKGIVGFFSKQKAFIDRFCPAVLLNY